MNVLTVVPKQIGSAARNIGSTDLYSGNFLRLNEWVQSQLAGGVPQMPEPEDVRQIRGFATLAPNWNSYGAKPIAPAAMAVAEKLLARVMRTFGIRPDIIAPVATGGVHFEWSGTEAEIDVRINPDGTYSYLSTLDGASSEMRGATADQVFDRVSKTFSN